MIYAAVFFTCMIGTFLFLCLLDLRPCDVVSLAGQRCEALVGRRGHDRHVWEPAPWPLPRLSDSLYERNLRAVMLEERIAMSVARPEDFVRVVTTP